MQYKGFKNHFESRKIMDNLKRTQTKILEALTENSHKIDQKSDTHLEGLLWQKPITYWDYIQTDALLNFQIQRTTLPDEMVFIMYHQVNELLFKMIFGKLNRFAIAENPTTPFFTETFRKNFSRYFDMLTNFF